MITLAHISDLHFGREQDAIIEALSACLDEQKPDLIIISGDLTQRARHKEFRRAHNFLSTLKFPYMVVPGNHDISAHNLMERFIYPWRKWRRYISEELQSNFAHPQFVAVGVNTARRFGLYLDWSRGRINEFQVSDVLSQFDQVDKECLKVVVAHHPFWLPGTSLSRELVGGRDYALKAFSEAGVDLILGGHVHIPFMKIVDGVLISHAGTTVSNRLIKGQPNSFNIIRGDHKKIELETWEWDTDFQLRQKKEFNKDAKGWAS